MDLLQKAILDAEELRGAAIKNAETLLLEKYSDQLKEAVDSILEQDEPLDAEPEMSGDMPAIDSPPAVDGSGDKSSISDKLQYAATEGEKICPCHKEDEVLEIKFDNLYREEEAMPSPAPMPEPAPAPIEAPPAAPPEAGMPMAAPPVPTAPAAPGTVPPALPGEEEEEPKLEEDMVEINEKQLYSMLEDLIVDTTPKPTGWMGAPKVARDEADNEKKAVVASGGNPETPAGEKEKEEKLKKQMFSLQTANAELTENNALLSSKLKSLKSKFQESLLLNAKLLYTNRTLKEGSLNERQKIQIAESISKAKTVDEVKLICESTKNAVTAGNRNVLPRSLQESIRSKVGGMGVTLERLQELAGIKKRK
jgi:hypothetical protein